jgi:hypothetical protein
MTRSKEDIKNKLKRDGMVKGLNGVTIQALYEFKYVKKSLDKILKGEERKLPVCQYCICYDYKIDGNTIPDPIENFKPRDIGKAIRRFIEVEKLAGEGLWPVESNTCE